MTNRCFSSSQLYALRNEISIRVLIEKTMRIPCRVAKGCFRFLCPVCNGFDTAVNPETNLARCFRCEKNFNTIDLVMLVRQAGMLVGSNTTHRKKSRAAAPVKSARSLPAFCLLRTATPLQNTSRLNR